MKDQIKNERKEIKKIAKESKIYLIEDAAHSIGSMYRNKPVGSIADLTTFSFFITFFNIFHITL